MVISIKTDKDSLQKFFSCLLLSLGMVLIISCRSGVDSAIKEGFPLSIQYTEIADEQPFDSLSLETIVNAGFTNIWLNSNKNRSRGDQILKYFQSKGLKIDFMTHGNELFDRDHAPSISVYDPRYEVEVQKKIVNNLQQVREIDNIAHVFPYIDEPFHRKDYLDYSEYTKAEFNRRYGYPMPLSFDEAKKDPRTQLDFLNFQSDVFRDGWLKTQKIVKEFDSRVRIAMTHDSHNVFGGGVNSNSQMAMDDVFHWGGGFADLFVYDIYPYQTFDYRYGEPGVFRKPRISQMHYTMAQLRNMTTTWGKTMGFWVGTYNKFWFVRFRGKEREAQYWAEREILFTAIANGADYIISPSDYRGNNLPIDRNHWNEYLEGIQILRKAGSDLLKTPKVKSEVCFLFPRTQYLLLQEEYFNVGLSFELVLRAFGELDILHEEQITDGNLNGYKALVICDVKLLPENVVGHIRKFVENGGIVIADCVPRLNEYLKSPGLMDGLFGVTNSVTDRIKREGQWVPFVNLAVKYSFPPKDGITDSPPVFDQLETNLFGRNINMKIVSPRKSELTGGTVLASTRDSVPALLVHKTGKGETFLIGFCLQDTYFHACKTGDEETMQSLYHLIHGILQDVNIHAHIYSSNPDIEATLRSNEKEAFIFVINHESENPDTEIILHLPDSEVEEIRDIESNKPIRFACENGFLKFSAKTGWGKTKLFQMVY
jgi:hypothetical protein